MSEWTVDLSANEARHTSGLVLRFTVDPNDPGALDGEVVGGPMPPIKDAARLMREAGDAYLVALKARQ